jgi:outer membrane protein assembly factor BamA
VLIHDLRDDPVRPTSGVVLTANGELAPGIPWTAITNPVRFAKGEGRASGYLPLGGLTLRLSGTGAHGRGLERGAVLPLEDRYRLGGTGSLRGFARDGVGPRNIAPKVTVGWPSAVEPVIDYAVRDDPERWVPTGGDTMALGVAELLVPLTSLGLSAWEGYSAAVFADVGNTWLLATPTLPTSQLPAYRDRVPSLRMGVGAGLRVATPIGPLQLDVATNLQRATAQGPTRTMLEREWEEPPVRVHLSLGALL